MSEGSVAEAIKKKKLNLKQQWKVNTTPIFNSLSSNKQNLRKPVWKVKECNMETFTVNVLNTWATVSRSVSKHIGDLCVNTNISKCVSKIYKNKTKQAWKIPFKPSQSSNFQPGLNRIQVLLQKTAPESVLVMDPANHKRCSRFVFTLG